MVGDGKSAFKVNNAYGYQISRLGTYDKGVRLQVSESMGSNAPDPIKHCVVCQIVAWSSTELDILS